MDQQSGRQSGRHQVGKRPPSLATRQDRSRPEQVWSRLSPAEQQIVLRTVVLVCRSLVNRGEDRTTEREVGDE